MKFLDEGEKTLIQLEDEKTKELTNFTMELPNGDKRVWTPNKTSLTWLVTKFGRESKEWIGKIITLKVVEQNVRGDMKQVIYPASDK